MVTKSGLPELEQQVALMPADPARQSVDYIVLVDRAPAQRMIELGEVRLATLEECTTVLSHVFRAVRQSQQNGLAYRA